MSEIPPNQSNYYRPGFNQTGGQMRSPDAVKISFDTISTAWRIVSGDWGTWIVATLVTFASAYAVTIPFQFASQIYLGERLNNPNLMDARLFVEYMALNIPVTVIGSIVQYFFLAGMMDIAYKKQMGVSAGLNDLFSVFSRWKDLLVAGLLYSVIVTIGYYLCILPGIALSGALAFAPLLILHQGMSGVEAMTRSNEVLTGNRLLMGFLVFCSMILAMLGMCACGVGLLFTFAIYPVTTAVVYYNFFPPMPLAEAPGDVAPPHFES